MNEQKKGSFTETRQVERMISLLESIDSHLASMVYYQNPESGGFAPAIEKAIAQPFIDESIETIIKKEIAQILGENLNGNNFRNR